jgi:hypothetical protein
MVGKHEGDFLKGLLYGTTLSISLWISLIGWIKLIISTLF